MSRTIHPLASAIAAIAERTPVHPSAPWLKRELDAVHKGAAALDVVNRSRSPLDTPAAHALKVAKMARSYNTSVLDALNRVLAKGYAAREVIDRRIAEKANLKPDSKYEVAIATAYGSLREPDRLRMLGELVDDNRGPELAAILQAPLSITGLSAQHREAFRTDFIAKHAAAELEERNALDEAMEAFNAAQKASSGFVKELTDPGNLAEFERGALAAEEASAAFDQSLQ